MKAFAIDAASASLRCCAAVGAIIAADIRSESKNFFIVYLLLLYLIYSFALIGYGKCIKKSINVNEKYLLSLFGLFAFAQNQPYEEY
jgi:hypothetical protein